MRQDLISNVDQTVQDKVDLTLLDTQIKAVTSSDYLGVERFDQVLSCLFDVVTDITPADVAATNAAIEAHDVPVDDYAKDWLSMFTS